MKFTVVYVHRWQTGSHWNSATKIARIETNPGELVGSAMNRLQIQNAQFLFPGWPLLEGETAPTTFILKEPLP